MKYDPKPSRRRLKVKYEEGPNWGRQPPKKTDATTNKKKKVKKRQHVQTKSVESGGGCHQKWSRIKGEKEPLKGKKNFEREKTLKGKKP